MDKTRLVVVKKPKNLLIADHCSQCGSEVQLSLLHLWYPPKRAEIEEEISRDFYNDLIDQGVIKEPSGNRVKSHWNRFTRKYNTEVEVMVDLVEYLYQTDFKEGVGTITLCEKCVSNRNSHSPGNI